MPSYTVRAKVEQIVTKEVKLKVVAKTKEEAENKARESLHIYPKELNVEGVGGILTTKANYWPPRDIQLKTEEQADA